MEQRSQATAQVETAGAIILAVQQVINALGQLQGQLAGTAYTAIGNASQDLNGLLHDFQTDVGDKLEASIQSFTDETQELGRRLTQSVDQINHIIGFQQQCLYNNTSAIVAAISNIVEGVKASTHGILSKANPSVSYFQFAGHAVGVVPYVGGSMTIEGYRLWDAQPKVEILSEDRKNHR